MTTQRPLGTSHRDYVRDRTARRPQLAAAIESARQTRELGDALADRREARGLSQRALAELTGIQQPVIARIERGGEAPTVTTIQKLARALDAVVEIGPAGVTMRPAQAAQKEIAAESRASVHAALPRFDFGVHANFWQNVVTSPLIYAANAGIGNYPLVLDQLGFKSQFLPTANAVQLFTLMDRVTTMAVYVEEGEVDRSAPSTYFADNIIARAGGTPTSKGIPTPVGDQWKSVA